MHTIAAVAASTPGTPGAARAARTEDPAAVATISAPAALTTPRARFSGCPWCCPAATRDALAARASLATGTTRAP